jgi:hypothetical protein
MNIKVVGESAPAEPTFDEVFKILEGNRGRLRSLATMILSVCGMLVSSSFVVLFFVLKEQSLRIPYAVPVLLFATATSLIGAVVLSILAVLPPTPVASPTRLSIIDTQVRLYRREYRRSVASVVLLLIGITLFVTALAVFGWSSFIH